MKTFNYIAFMLNWLVLMGSFGVVIISIFAAFSGKPDKQIFIISSIIFIYSLINSIVCLNADNDSK